MKKYTEQQLEHMYNQFRQILEKYVTGNNKDVILSQLLPDFETNILVSPAASKTFFNDANPGGWLNHTLNTIKISLQLMQLWQKNNINIDFTIEQLILAAALHDFGKLGTKEQMLYLPQTSKWHADRGSAYIFNPKIPFMKAHDRTLFILQQYGIQLNFNVTLAIKLSSGMYQEANKSYYMQYDQVNILSTILPHIIHQADMIAVNIKE